MFTARNQWRNLDAEAHTTPPHWQPQRDAMNRARPGRSTGRAGWPGGPALGRRPQETRRTGCGSDSRVRVGYDGSVRQPIRRGRARRSRRCQLRMGSISGPFLPQVATVWLQYYGNHTVAFKGWIGPHRPRRSAAVQNWPTTSMMRISGGDSGCAAWVDEAGTAGRGAKPNPLRRSVR